MASSTDSPPPGGAHPRRRKARAHVVHAVPGRTRLVVPNRRGDRAFFAEVMRRLSTSRGVHSVRVDPLTGSVVVHHDADVLTLLRHAASHGLGDLLELALTCPPIARRLREQAAAVDGAIRRASRGELDLGTVAALGLLAMAGFQLIRGRGPTSAASLAWYSAELLTRWRESQPPGELPSEALTSAS